MSDLVIAIDEATIIRYANPACEVLMGWPPADLVGRSVAELLHPDDLDRAAEVVGLMQGDGLGVAITPADYRVRHRDGHYVPLEINAAEPVPEGQDRGLVVLVVRYSGDAHLQSRVLELLTTNAPVDEIIALVPGFGSWRHPDDHYALRYHDALGQPVGVGSEVVTRLMAAHDGPRTPWAIAEGGVDVMLGLDDLDPALAAAAEAEGLHVCWVLPVEDPLHGCHATLLSWTGSGARPLVHRYALEMMGRSLRLILQWRHHMSRLEHAANTDPLTGVANRAAFFAELGRRLDHEPGLVGVLVVDLDKFKPVNDQFGHAVGDEVLTRVSDRLRAAVRDGDLVARLGGDEFAVVLPALRDPAEAEAAAARIVEVLGQPIPFGDGRVEVGASVGVAVSLDGATPLLRLLEQADTALYEVKSAGGGGWRRSEGDPL
jgi:diguanylate cyclase (GGDEF)-like protein/PAS domain S-box-containing protein